MDTSLSSEVLDRLRDGVGLDTLEHLDLSNGLLVPNEVGAIGDAMADYQTKHSFASPLVTIDLSGNLICGLDEHGEGEYDVSGLVKLVKTIVAQGDKSNIRSLTLFRNNIGTPGCNAITQLLNVSGPNFLQEINLRNCFISNLGIKQLCIELGANKTLQFLDLRSNDFTAEGANYLAKALAVNRTLKRLDISHSYIGAEGLDYLCPALQTNVALQILCMVECNLKDNGAAILANVLLANQNIQYLDIQDNGITDVGAAALSPALAKNTGLVMIGLQFNSITNAGALQIAKSIRRHPNLNTFYLFGNDVDEGGASLCMQQMMSLDDKREVFFDVPYQILPPLERKKKSEGEADDEES